MNIAIPEWLAPWLVGVGLAGVAISLVVAIRAYIQLRRGEYYMIREEARRRTLRASLLGFIFVVLTIGALFVPRQEPVSVAPATATAQSQATASPTPETPPASPSASPTTPATAAVQATATEPFIPTLTPQATRPMTFTTPIPSAVPPPGDARFEFWTLAEGSDANNQPVNPGSEFAAGVERIYLFFRFDGLLPNVPWTTLWYWEDRLISGNTSLWEPERATGERHVFLEFPGGYAAGEYEVQIWLGDRLQIRADFSVVPPEG